eukprot:31270-Pelagococcus_subviridis.AAC.10
MRINRVQSASASPRKRVRRPRRLEEVFLPKHPPQPALRVDDGDGLVARRGGAQHRDVADRRGVALHERGRRSHDGSHRRGGSVAAAAAGCVADALRLLRRPAQRPHGAEVLVDDDGDEPSSDGVRGRLRGLVASNDEPDRLSPADRGEEPAAAARARRLVVVLASPRLALARRVRVRDFAAERRVHVAVAALVDRHPDVRNLAQERARVDAAAENERLRLAREETTRRARPQIERVRGFVRSQHRRGRRTPIGRGLHRSVQEAAEPARGGDRDVVLVERRKERVVFVERRETPRAVDEIERLRDAPHALLLLLRRRRRRGGVGVGVAVRVAVQEAVHADLVDLALEHARVRDGRRRRARGARRRGRSGFVQEGLRRGGARLREIRVLPRPRRASSPDDVLDEQRDQKLRGAIAQHLGRRREVQRLEPLQRRARARRVARCGLRLRLAHHNLGFHGGAAAASQVHGARARAHRGGVRERARVDVEPCRAPLLLLIPSRVPRLSLRFPAPELELHPLREPANAADVPSRRLRSHHPEVRPRGEIHPGLALRGRERRERAIHGAVRHERVHERAVALRVRRRPERPSNLSVHRLHRLDAAGVVRAQEPSRRARFRSRGRRVRHRVRIHVRVARARGHLAHPRDERPRPVRSSAFLARGERDVVRALRRRHARLFHLSKHRDARQRVLARGVRLRDAVPRRLLVGHAVVRDPAVLDPAVPGQDAVFKKPRSDDVAARRARVLNREQHSRLRHPRRVPLRPHLVPPLLASKRDVFLLPFPRGGDVDGAVPADADLAVLGSSALLPRLQKQQRLSEPPRAAVRLYQRAVRRRARADPARAVQLSK